VSDGLMKFLHCVLSALIIIFYLFDFNKNFAKVWLKITVFYESLDYACTYNIDLSIYFCPLNQFELNLSQFVKILTVKKIHTFLLILVHISPLEIQKEKFVKKLQMQWQIFHWMSQIHNLIKKAQIRISFLNALL